MMEKLFQLLGAQQQFDPPQDELSELIDAVMNEDAAGDVLEEDELEFVRAARKDGPVPPFRPTELK